jgi:hypothetical protein
MLFTSVLGFVAAAFAAGSVVSAVPLVDADVNAAAKAKVAIPRDLGLSLNVCAGVNLGAGANASSNIATSVAGGLGQVLVDLKASIGDACAPILSVTDEASVTADIVVSVQAKVVAAVNVAIGSCHKIIAQGGLNVSITDCISIALEICAILQIIVAAFGKLTCGCIAAEVAAAVLAIDGVIAELLKLVLTIVGGIAATLIGNLVALLHIAGCINVFASLKFVLTLGVLGL